MSRCRLQASKPFFMLPFCFQAVNVVHHEHDALNQELAEDLGIDRYVRWKVGSLQDVFARGEQLSPLQSEVVGAIGGRVPLPQLTHDLAGVHKHLRPFEPCDQVLHFPLRILRLDLLPQFDHALLVVEELFKGLGTP